MSKTVWSKKSIYELKKLVEHGLNIPGYYYTYDQTRAATELRKRGYRVSLLKGTVKKIKPKK